MKSCAISEAALLKVLLHGAKHPTSAVNGVLLGTAAGGVLEIDDALPVCHSFVTLSPMLEAALAQVEQLAADQQGQRPGLRLLGYYQCNERLGDGELGAGRRYADRIEAAHPDSVALVMDSVALQAALRRQGQPGGGGAQSDPPALQLYCKDGGRWVRAPAGSFKCPTEGVAAQLVQLLEQGRAAQLADFEDHLEDLAADWLNPGLVQGPA